jgi:hypothetical protein
LLSLSSLSSFRSFTLPNESVLAKLRDDDARVLVFAAVAVLVGVRFRLRGVGHGDTDDVTVARNGDNVVGAPSLPSLSFVPVLVVILPLRSRFENDGVKYPDGNGPLPGTAKVSWDDGVAVFDAAGTPALKENSGTVEITNNYHKPNG